MLTCQGRMMAGTGHSKSAEPPLEYQSDCGDTVEKPYTYDQYFNCLYNNNVHTYVYTACVAPDQHHP